MSIREMIKEQAEELKANPLTVDQVIEKIKAATSVQELDKLRMACVSVKTQRKEVLEMWQKKYWAAKKCPTCGGNL